VPQPLTSGSLQIKTLTATSMPPMDHAADVLTDTTGTKTPSYALKSVISVPFGIIKPATASHVTQTTVLQSMEFAAQPLLLAVALERVIVIATAKLSITTESV
jgi:hypothetical protein